MTQLHYITPQKPRVRRIQRIADWLNAHPLTCLVGAIVFMFLLAYVLGFAIACPRVPSDAELPAVLRGKT